MARLQNMITGLGVAITARLNTVFSVDLSVCPKCGGKLRVIGEVTEPNIIARMPQPTLWLNRNSALCYLCAYSAPVSASITLTEDTRKNLDPCPTDGIHF